MSKLAVTIVTLNEAKNISACLASVSFADDILIVDSGSSDGTVELAQQLGARVVHQPWLGFGPQKQFAVEQAKHDWVLCLDADERVSPELARSIQTALQAPSADAYQMPRCNRFLGRWLRHGEGYPDQSLRLFNRKKARWSSDTVHEKVLCDGPAGQLSGDLMHYSEDGIAQYLAKQSRYTSLQAEQLIQRGKSFSVFQMLFSPWVRFIKFYCFRRGFQDGVPGLIHILIGCMNSFLKYAKLYELRRQDTQICEASTSAKRTDANR